MVLKFDDVIYKQSYEIEYKDESVSVEVFITDKESEEISDMIIGALRGEVDTDDGFIQVLFKDDLGKLKEVLVGHNFNQFLYKVMGDYQNFILGSLLGAMKPTTQPEKTEA